MTATASADRAATAVTAAPDPREAAPALCGPVRLGRRTKELTRRLEPGAVAVLDHPDLDGVAARALAARRPLAVLNARPFVTGRFPNRGPQLLLAAGVPLFEAPVAGPDLFALLADGEGVSLLPDGTLEREGRASAAPAVRLAPLTADRLAARLAAARANLDDALSAFAENTLRFLARAEERALLLDPVAVPDLRTPLAGRDVLVVVRGDGYEDDLRRLSTFLAERRPVVLAVDGAADALLALGIRPDVILGDMDSAGDAALACGAELIVHAYPRPRPGGVPDAPGMARVRALGLRASAFPVAGTSEDAALLLAYEKGADLIVAVGTHTNLEDFLEKGRGGMASTFLVRLKVGSRLVDARGVSRLYARRPPGA